MVVDQALKGIETARACVVKKSQTGGRGQDHAVAVKSYVGYVIGQQAISPAQHLLFSAQLIKQNQPVRRSNRNHAVGRIGKNAVDAEDIVVFIMRRAAKFGIKQVKTVIEISNPEAIC